MSQEFTPPHTIEYRHVIAAVPGNTLRQKYDWIQNAVHDVAVFRDTDAAARRMAAALGEIGAVISAYKARLAEDSSLVYCVDDMNTIAKIVGKVE